MSPHAIFLPEAEDELNRAADYYEAECEGLGKEFLAAVEARLQSALNSPAAFQVAYGSKIRRTLVNRFPYGIWFVDQPTEIIIVAVLHSHRDHRRVLRKRI